VLKILLFLEILVAIGTALFYFSLTRAARRDIGTFPGVVFAVMTAIIFLSPQLVIAHVAIGLVPIALARSKIKVGMAVIVGIVAVPPLELSLMLGSVPLFGWSLQMSLSVGGLVALLLAPGSIPSKPLWANSMLFVTVLILIFMGGRGTAWTNWFRLAAEYFFTYALPVYVIARSARNAVEQRMLLAALAGAGVILSLIVLYEARGNWPMYAPLIHYYDLADPWIGIIVKWRGGLMRAYGPMYEATIMGCVLVVCFTSALAARRAFASNATFIGIVSLIALGTLAPQSRGAMMGIAVSFIISSFYRRGVSSLKQVAAAAFLLVGAYVGANAMSTQIKTSLNEAAGTIDYRSRLFTRGMEEFWKSPVIGAQKDQVIKNMQDLVQGEGIVDFVNTYLYFALFAGVVGLALFCLTFAVPMWRLTTIRSRLSPGSADRDVAGFCVALLGSATVMLVSSSYMVRPGIYMMLASGVALSIRASGRQKRVTNMADIPAVRLEPVAAS
jgi:O-Antigen ligase